MNYQLKLSATGSRFQHQTYVDECKKKYVMQSGKKRKAVSCAVVEVEKTKVPHN
jgi:hypothetical protein